MMFCSFYIQWITKIQRISKQSLVPKNHPSASLWGSSQCPETYLTFSCGLGVPDLGHTVHFGRHCVVCIENFSFKLKFSDLLVTLIWGDS